MKLAHGNTACLALLGALVCVGGLASSGCMSKKEVNEARRSVYDTDFAVVYGATVEAVRSLYPSFEEDPTVGIIKTSWHQVKYTDPGADDPKSTQTRDRAAGVGTASPNSGALGYSPSLARKINFIRFDIAVVGGRPWRVRVIGRASQMEPGNALPTELRGASAPHWLGGRTDAMVVAIHRRLKKYAQIRPDDPPPAAEVIEDVVIGGELDDGARTAAAEIVRALRKRDYAALRAQVAADVVWSLGAAPGVDVAMAMWQADPTVLAALEAAIEGGCGAVGTDVSCPAAPAPGKLHARFAARGTAWKLVAFVEAER
jgi:hypothetical protein